MAVANLANRVQVNTNCGNNDALYGPYNSIDEALTLIPSALINGKGAIGRTIGVIEDGKVVEYWWQPVGDGYGFVKKGVVEIIVDSELNITSTNPIQNQAVANALGGKADKVTKQEVDGDQTIAPNTMYVWDSVAGALTITKGTDNTGIVNNYMVRFTAGEGCVVTFSGFELDWYGGEAPTWTAGNTYEISIVDNIALWAEFEPTQA